MCIALECDQRVKINKSSFGEDIKGLMRSFGGDIKELKLI